MKGDAFTAGRVVGGVVGAVVGLVEADTGANMVVGGITGGAVTCAETLGAGCVAGVSVAGAGTAVTAVGVATAGNGINAAVDQLNTLLVGRTEGHHPWPKYLGGPSQQDLLPLSEDLHHQFHAGLDQIYARTAGSRNWQQLNVAQQEEILQSLLAYTQDFDAMNGTGTQAALMGQLNALGIPLPPSP